MMLRRSMKRCSRSPQSEVNNFENTAPNSLEKKKRKLETKVETNDGKLLENTKGSTTHSRKEKFESSDSSSDEFMRAPLLSDIDLSKFPVKKDTLDFTAVENNILAGVTRLSDSEDSDFDGDSKIKANYFPPGKQQENTRECIKTGRKKKSLNSTRSRNISGKRNTSTESLNVVNDRMKVLSAPDVNKMDVSQLLALGEISETIPKVHTAVIDRAHDSTSDSENNLSDWEDVEGLDVKPIEHVIPKEGIEVTLEMPDLHRKQRKKGYDLEAHLRRRLNRVKRELQVLIHKVHLLCWIAHGQYINSIVNSEVLMALSLSLVPSQHCYPSKHTNLRYLEQILAWFKKTVAVSDETENKPLLPLCEALQQSFQLRTASSTYNLVLMFICILRTLGIKARLIMSLQPIPLKPSSQELFSINKRREEKKSNPKEDAAVVKVENTDARDTNQATTSKKSMKDGKKDLKCKKSESTNKVKVEKPVDNKCKKNNETSSNSNFKSKTQDVKPAKRSRNNSDMSKGKTDELKRILRTRKETVNTYKDRSDSSDEDDTSSEERRVACRKKQSPKTKFSNDGHLRKGPTDDVHLIKHQKSSSKVKESRSNKEIKAVNVNTKKGNSSQTALSVKQDVNSDSDSDFVPESLSSHKSRDFKRTESADSNSESDFDLKQETQTKKSTNRKVPDRRVIASDSGTSRVGKGAKKKHCDIWTEVFLEEEEKWISVDVQSGKLHCVSQLHSRATQPVMYVLAFNNDLTLKDVTCRYCVQFSTVTRKLRVDEKWWKESLSPFLTAPTAHDREEDEELNRLMLDRPMPTTLKEFKNHPLYVLKNDLLKFEAIYPPNAPPLGFVRGKPIYARECVHVLHSREIWMKDAKIVQVGETPYKIVKARPKYDKFLV
ncbi:DNA repair protein complementing XP-C cells homolog isoform X2 [Zootermopsis nevadensis]|uniref:DNA repair protein complementing XP-C cells homolog isoform X2 n=1 Tax=Zootermopsis nevadensis TaxID=136037 RepID=UPI000B8E2AB4|nr:DNA repair protein complementing XP-C cells homolog isoform X2 [Zootermopsis nevadensis]